MVFINKSLLLAATALFAQALAGNPCDGSAPSPYGDWSPVGNANPPKDSKDFCASKQDQGKVIKGIEAWGDGERVWALKFYYSDGSESDTIGSPGSRESQQIQWDPQADKIEAFRMWGDGRATGLGKLYVTAGSKTLEVGRNPENSQAQFEPNKGAGIILGAVGKASDRIDVLAFQFLRDEIEKVEVEVDLGQDLEEKMGKKQGLKTVVVVDTGYDNTHSSSDVTWVFGNTNSVKNTKKVTNDATNSFGVKAGIEVSGEVAGFGTKASFELSYAHESKHGEEVDYENGDELRWEGRPDIKAGKKLFCRATAQYGEYNADYTGKTNLHLKDGTVYSFTASGTYSTTQYAEVSGTCQDNEFEPIEGDKITLPGSDSNHIEGPDGKSKRTLAGRLEAWLPDFSS